MIHELNAATINMIAKKIDLSIGEFSMLIALKSWTSLVFKTPVGNPSLWKSKPPKGYVGGRAKYSWNLSFSRPDTAQPVTWSESGLPATPKKKPRAYETIFVTSSIPYMEVLEEGKHSTQGGHMIKRTISEINLQLKTAL